MAIRVTEIPDSSDIHGKTRVKFFDVTLDTAYPTGGSLIPPGMVGMRVIFGGKIVGGNAAAAVLHHHLDTSSVAGSVKVLSLFPTGGKAGMAPSTLADPITAAGAVATTGDAIQPNLVPGKAQEVAVTTDLHSMVLRIQFSGN